MKPQKDANGKRKVYLSYRWKPTGEKNSGGYIHFPKIKEFH